MRLSEAGFQQPEMGSRFFLLTGMYHFVAVWRRFPAAGCDTRTGVVFTTIERFKFFGFILFLKEQLTVMKKNAFIFVVLITGLALGLAPAALAAG